MTFAHALKTMTISATLLCSTVGALGQVTSNLPGSIVQSASINASTHQQISEYVTSLAGQLSSNELRDSVRAREQLIRPLSDRDVSVAFRQAYAQSLSALMGELNSSDEFEDQLLALRLAGELGTTESISMIRSRLTTQDEALRLFAYGRAQRVFEITAAHGPAIAGTEAITLVNAVVNQAKTESELMLVEAGVRALSAGTMLPTDDLSPARNKSIQSLADLLSPIFRGLKSDHKTDGVYRLGLRATSAMTASINDIGADTDPDSTKAAIGLAGDVLSVPMRQIIAGRTLGSAERDLTVRAVQSAEALMYFGRRKLSGSSNADQTSFAEMLKTKEDRDYRNAVSSLLGANSAIVREIGCAGDRFVF